MFNNVRIKIKNDLAQTINSNTKIEVFGTEYSFNNVGTSLSRIFAIAKYKKVPLQCKCCQNHGKETVMTIENKHLVLGFDHDEKFRRLTVDHDHLKSMKGSNDISNLNILCKDCNLERGNRFFTLESFIVNRGKMKRDFSYIDPARNTIVFGKEFTTSICNTLLEYSQSSTEMPSTKALLQIMDNKIIYEILTNILNNYQKKYNIKLTAAQYNAVKRTKNQSEPKIMIGTIRGIWKDLIKRHQIKESASTPTLVVIPEITPKLSIVDKFMKMLGYEKIKTSKKVHK